MGETGSNGAPFKGLAWNFFSLTQCQLPSFPSTEKYAHSNQDVAFSPPTNEKTTPSFSKKRNSNKETLSDMMRLSDVQLLAFDPCSDCRICNPSSHQGAVKVVYLGF